MPSQSNSSKRWLNRQQKDPFVKKAKAAGLRSRASFKLQAIQERYRIIKKGATVMDLGAAPGSWSAEAVQNIGPSGRLIACDLLAMDPIAGIDFIQGDFTDPLIQAELDTLLDGQLLDVILSDMAPNFSGVAKADQWAIIGLNEMVLAFCQSHLKVGGHLVMKCFQGDGIEDLMRTMRHMFQKHHMYKPEASRKDSKECFAVCIGFKG
jgi:23S rRNA (uridine2552-2'-O)-methyltransferase